MCVLIGLFVPHPQSKRGATPTMATAPSCVFPRARWLGQPVPAPCTSPVATASVWVRVGVGVAACGHVGVAVCGRVGVAACGHVGVWPHVWSGVSMWVWLHVGMWVWLRMGKGVVGVVWLHVKVSIQR